MVLAAIVRATHIHVKRVPAERGRRGIHLLFDLLLLFQRQFRQLSIINLVSLLRGCWQNMHQAALEVLSVEILVGLYGCICVEVLDVGKPLAGINPGIESHMDLGTLA